MSEERCEELPAGMQLVAVAALALQCIERR